MKRTTHFILFFAIIIFILSACGGGASTQATGVPNADSLVEFNEQGVAVIEGRILSGGYTPSGNGSLNETLDIAVPVKVDGVKTSAGIPVRVRYETEISSSLTKFKTVREYMIYNPGSSAYNAFPTSAQVQVTVKKSGGAFEAVSIRETEKRSSFFRRWPSIRGIVVTDGFNQGTITGSIRQAYNQNNGDVLWMFSVPVQVQGVDAYALLTFESASDTTVITPDGNVEITSRFDWDPVQIRFTRRGQTLTAREITVLP